jgi:hypothetical protein
MEKETARKVVIEIRWGKPKIIKCPDDVLIVIINHDDLDN